MKNKIIIISVSVIAAIAVAVTILFAMGIVGKKAPEVKSISESGIENYSEIMLTAHRGFSAVAPENTLAAFKKAGEAGFYAAECDIYLTKDGVWVLSHDEDIKRMTDGKGAIEDYTYEELQQFKIDAGNNIENFPDEKIPTLEEYVEVCAKTGIKPEIEIKKGSNEKLSEILDILEKYNMKKEAIIISFKKELLDVLRADDKEIELWYLVNEITDEEVELCLNSDFAVAFNSSENKNDVIKAANEKGVKLCAWTIDDFEELKRVYECGVRYITTNSIIPTSVND